MINGNFLLILFLFTNFTVFDWVSSWPISSSYSESALIVEPNSTRSNETPIKNKAEIEPTSLKVWSITFIGNKTYSDIVLDEVIALEAAPYFDRTFYKNIDGYDFSDIEAKKDAIRIERFYKRRGFIDAKVELKVSEGKKWWQRNIVFTIYEGKPIIIQNVEYRVQNPDLKELILGNKAIINDQKKQPLREEKRFEQVRIKEVTGIFEQDLKNIGFPFGKIQIDYEIDSARYSANLAIIFQASTRAYIDNIEIEGDLSVSKEYVLKEADLKIGTLFSQKKIGEAQQELFNHNLFRFITISIPDQVNDSTVSLKIRIQENPLRVLTVRGGVGTEELVRSEILWTHLNPFGNAHSITVKSRASLNTDFEFRQARFGVDYNIPYLFNTKSGTQTSPFIEYKNEYSYKLNRIGLNNSFLYQHSIELQSSVAHEYTFNRIGEKSSRTVDQDSLQFYNISSLQFGAFYRQGFLNRELGWYINPLIELSGLFGSGTYTYQKFYLDIRRFVDLGKTTQLGFKSNVGFLNVDKSDNLPAAIRLYAGGRSSVRGWLLDELGPKRVRTNDNGSFDRFVPTGGKVLLAMSAEIRQTVNFPFHGLGFAAFLDGGQVWRSVSDIDILSSFDSIMETKSGDSYNGLQFGLGGGIFYNSPIGPIRIDIAYKLNPTQADLGMYQGVNYGSVVSRWGIHFSLGHPF